MRGNRAAQISWDRLDPGLIPGRTEERLKGPRTMPIGPCPSFSWGARHGYFVLLTFHAARMMSEGSPTYFEPRFIVVIAANNPDVDISWL